MALTFYCGSGSPFAWRVWLSLEFKGVPYELKMISFSDREHKKPEYLDINPRGKIPAISDDGFALYESAAIVEYLDERFPDGPPLIGKTLRTRAITRRLIQEADQYFLPAMDPLLDAVLFTPRENWSEEAIAPARDKAAAEMVWWEKSMGPAFLTGDAPNAADFTLYPHLALTLRVDKRKPDVGVGALVGPNMRAWMQRVEALPYLDRTVPPHWKK